jgi:hypothetical protein
VSESNTEGRIKANNEHEEFGTAEIYWFVGELGGWRDFFCRGSSGTLPRSLVTLATEWEAVGRWMPE